MIRIVRRLASAARRAVLGISPEEIRYTFEDVRRELRAARRDLDLELEAIRKDVQALRGGDSDVGPERREELPAREHGEPAAKA